MSQPAQERGVIFDFFGVICSEIAPVWTRRRLPDADVREIHERFVRGGDAGTVSPDEVYTNLARLAHMQPAHVKQEWEDLIAIDQEVMAIIRRLHGKVKLGLCSNAWSAFIRPILVSEHLEELFDTIVISSEERMTKPDPRMFLLTAERLGLTPSACTCIDDNPANIAIATGLGMQGIVFESAADLSPLLS